MKPPVRAEQPDELSFRKLKVDTVERPYAPVALAEAPDRERRRHPPSVGARPLPSRAVSAPATLYPKIELHVHLEATVQPETLLAIARRNGEALPVDTVEGVRELYRFRDFDHFIEVWILTTNCLRREEDFRQVVVDYAAEARRHGAVYLEAIFSPIERTWRGVSWDEKIGRAHV